LRESETIFAMQNADELWLESCGILDISAASQAPGHNRDTPCTSPGFDIRASCLWGSEIDAVRPPLALWLSLRLHRRPKRESSVVLRT